MNNNPSNAIAPVDPPEEELFTCIDCEEEFPEGEIFLVEGHYRCEQCKKIFWAEYGE